MSWICSIGSTSTFCAGQQGIPQTAATNMAQSLVLRELNAVSQDYLFVLLCEGRGERLDQALLVGLLLLQ
jgi:hypothetical protein